MNWFYGLCKSFAVQNPASNFSASPKQGRSIFGCLGFVLEMDENAFISSSLLEMS